MSSPLTVVVCSMGTAPLDRTLESLLASASAAGLGDEAAVEVVVVWQGPVASAPVREGVRTIDVFPVGLSYARNRGLAAATAPLVAFVDDDEVVDAGWVRGLLDAFEAAPSAAAVFGEVAPLDASGIPYCVVTGDSPRAFRRPSTPPWVVGTGGNMAFRRDVLLESGGFDTTLGAGAPGHSAEESDVIVRLLRSNHEAAWTPNAVVFHPTKTAAEHLASRRPYAHGLGVVARRRRDAGLAARYGLAAVQSWTIGARTRDRRRCREAARTIAGFAEGLVAGRRFASPDRFLARMPPEVAQALGGRTLRPGAATYGDDPEFRYDAPEAAVRLVVGPRAADRAVDAPAGALVVVDRDATWIVETGRPR